MIKNLESIIEDLNTCSDMLPENANHSAYSIGYAVAKLEGVIDQLKKNEEWSNQNHGC